MNYPKLPDIDTYYEQIALYSQLKHERGAAGIREVLNEVEQALDRALKRMKKLEEDEEMIKREPSHLPWIQTARPQGPRWLWDEIDGEVYREKLTGALQSRLAGCTLGSPVEGWSIEEMKMLAELNKQSFPPTRYWKEVPDEDLLRYGVSPLSGYTQKGMKGVPVDDDIMYTLLNLLILEEYGPEFTTDDVGKAWLKYLPFGYTAEAVALSNLQTGSPANRAGSTQNPYCEWIGGSIRADAWGYAAPGWPEMAASMAYQDAFLSHRRQGIYGAMFWAAVIAAAFAVDDTLEAVQIGLSEIPRTCHLGRAVRWALREGEKLKDYEQARALVDERFEEMSPVHTVNNACLVVFGLMLGGDDVSAVLGQTVAMGLDNDSNAATAGSVVGAALGAKKVPSHWTKSFDDTIHSYLEGKKTFKISQVIDRFAKQAERVFELE